MTLVVVGNSVRIALPVLQAAYAMGEESCILAGTRETLGLRWSSLCRRHVLIDLDDDARSVRLINGIAQEDLPALEMLDDKWRFYRFCEAHALLMPATRHVGSKANLDFGALEAGLGLPFIVKPTNSSGSMGVQIVRNRADLEEKIRGNAAYRFGPLIAQRYIDGVDMGINVLSLRGQLCAFSIHRVANWP